MFTSYIKFTTDCWGIVKSLTGIAINILYLGLPLIGACFTFMFWVLGSLLYLCCGCFWIAVRMIPIVATLLWNAILVVSYVLRLIVAKVRHTDYPNRPQLSEFPKSRLISTTEISGDEFEKYVAKLLANKGYHNIKFTPVSGDYGVDILATKHGKVYAFQCKRYTGSVGIQAVQEIYSGSRKYHADGAIVITNSKYTANAKELANDLGVSLWNLEMLDSIFCE